MLPVNGFKYSGEFKTLFKEVATEYDLIFMPFFLEDIAINPSLNLEDGLHPNREGYTKIVNNLYPYLIKAFKQVRK